MTTYYVDPQTSTAAVWTADTVYGLSDRVWATDLAGAAAGYIFECTTGGTSGSSQPSWVTTTPDTSTTSDGTVTWTCRNPDSWTEALPGLQGAVDRAVAGEIVYCRGTQTLTAAISVDTNSGSAASGFIKVIGCNASGNVDGTTFKLNGNAAAANCLTTNKDWIWFENIEMYAATGDGFATASGTVSNLTMVHCMSRNHPGGDGFDTYWGNGLPKTFIRCTAHSNSGSGWARAWEDHRFIFCVAYDNSGDGIQTPNVGHGILHGCISYNNSDHGINVRKGILVSNCVVDENDDDGINVASGFLAFAIGNRFTDNGKDTSGYGINATGRCVYGWNFLIDNDSGATNGLLDLIPYDADADTNETSGTEGYTDGAARDYNVTSSATLRAVAIELD